MPDNTIIIPTYNHIGNLSECLRSVLATTDLSRTEVMVVANGCADGTEDYVSGLGGVRLLSFPQPLGFTGAVNAGIMASSTKRVVLLNDDCVIIEWGGGDGWVRMLEGPFLEDPQVVATGSTRDLWAREKYFLVFFCVMLRRDVLDEVGLLDMAFNPGAGEDADFCLKAQALGYKVRQVPVQMDHWRSGFPIWHVGGLTCGNLPGWRDIAERNHRLLEERYPRTDEDRELQRRFSDGLQNMHRWAKEKAATESQQ